ncbi:MAG TPA: class I SAM-dependent methyltransferase [Candidatus Limnocylindria bacterium]|jgi:SAM-dependent methyltransferase
MSPPDESRPDDVRAVEIVGAGYDRMAARYLASNRSGGARDRYLERLLALLTAASDVLELGCGAGEPVTRGLAQRHRVTAVDISAEQLRMAAARAPGARFLQASMLDVAFEAATFDAVAAFCAITHVPRQHHADLLGRIAGWLRPGGVLLISMGASDDPGTVEGDWLGVPMYFSHFDAVTNQGLVQRAGFELVEAEVVEEIGPDGTAERFLWIIGRRLRGAEAGG